MSLTGPRSSVHLDHYEGHTTPANVHDGRAPVIQGHRAAVLDAAYATHAERFVRKPPRPLSLPVWINEPKELPTLKMAQHAVPWRHLPLGMLTSAGDAELADRTSAGR